MTPTPTRHGPDELRAVRAEQRSLFLAVFVFSALVNLLMLTGPLYMLQIYDRVLGSQSQETLVAMTVLMVMLFAMMGILDHVRSRITARIGARFVGKLDLRVFSASVRLAAVAPNDPSAQAAQRDLDAIHRLLTSPVLMSVFDIPWTPLFVAVIFVFHPALGVLALVGGGALIAITVFNQISTRRQSARAAGTAVVSDKLADQIRSEAELVQSLGMRGATFARLAAARREASAAALDLSDRGGAFSAGTKTFRLFLQSAMLGLGAWLVLSGELTPGAMIAGSILLGRALAPIEQAVGQWVLVQRAQESWQRLGQLLARVPPETETTPLPKPRALIEVQNISVAPPGEPVPVLRGVSFKLEPGLALGVIGPSGAGKSTLARAICGVWRPLAGKVRLDGAALDQFDPDVLGRYIGYLPQRITLFDGTLAENIARLDTNPDPEAVVRAARAAAAHDMILQLPQGYDTRVSSIGGRLSGGQMQRIGLARALYGDPVLLVLDEPNSNLDNDGSQALNTAIRGMKSAGKSVMIMAHRPAAIQECDLLLVLDNGQRVAFGPRDEVLRQMVQNHGEISRAGAKGGVA